MAKKQSRMELLNQYTSRTVPGGVSGLLVITDASQGSHFCTYDGNGNVTALVKADGSGLSAQYEYGPFGEVLRATGPIAKANPFRFSTKYQDDQSDYLYYGYRYYNPNTGRWLNRDPLGDEAFFTFYTKGKSRVETRHLRREALKPLYLFVGNAPVGAVDELGLACFRYRPLSGCMSIFGVMGNKKDDKDNTVIAHEQLFFDDGGDPANIGFFGDGTLKTETDTRKYRKGHDCGYNDCVMRKAVANVKPGTYCLLGKKGVEKNNCQDWADKVRAEYRRLVQDPDVRKERSTTPEEEKK